MNRSTIFSLIALIAIILGVSYLVMTSPAPVKQQQLVTNFNECASAGYPVMESYPRQCRAPSGELFVENVSNPNPNPVPNPVGKSCGASFGSCPNGYKCIEKCGPPVVRQDDPPPGYSCLSPAEQQSRERYGCPICLSKNTKIRTPLGEIAVQSLKAGMPVYSTDSSDKEIIVPVIKVSSTKVSNHHVYRIKFDSGNELFVSPEHPLADGRKIEELQVGEIYSGFKIIEKELVPYSYDRTYDLLPAGETGFYWANDIPIGSTLH